MVMAEVEGKVCATRISMHANYSYFRNYDPGTGRYLESDPIGLEGGLNASTYVLGDPINGVDPTGLSPFAHCLAERRWDWGQLGSSGSEGSSTIGDASTALNLANAAANRAAGATGSGMSSASHATSWQHRVGSNIGQSAQQTVNGKSFGSTQAAWSSAGKMAGRLALLPLIWEGYWDIGSAIYCGCSAK